MRTFPQTNKKRREMTSVSKLTLKKLTRRAGVPHFTWRSFLLCLDAISPVLLLVMIQNESVCQLALVVYRGDFEICWWQQLNCLQMFRKKTSANACCVYVRIHDCAIISRKGFFFWPDWRPTLDVKRVDEREPRENKATWRI